MWVLFSLLTAFFLATSDALTKKVLSSRDEYYVAWARLVFALPVFVISLLYTGIPPLDATFWRATAIALPLEITAIILYTKALKVSPLSVTMPFLALTPLFLIAISYVVLGEKVSLRGAIGIVLMAAGSYTLYIHKAGFSIVEPLKAIVREKGTVMMIIVACIFSFTSSLGKLAIEHSSPVFFGSFYFILITVIFTPIALKKTGGNLSIGKKDLLPLGSIGITYAMMITFHMIAMSMVNVAYMISVKRTSLLFSVFYGYIMFREKHILEKTVGSLIMIAGFVMIVLSK